MDPRTLTPAPYTEQTQTSSKALRQRSLSVASKLSLLEGRQFKALEYGADSGNVTTLSPKPLDPQSLICPGSPSEGSRIGLSELLLRIGIKFVLLVKVGHGYLWSKP